MKQSLPKKIEWIPSDYVFGTANFKLKGILKRGTRKIHREKLNTNQKISICLPTIDEINQRLRQKNYSRVDLAEFLKKKDKKNYTVFHSITSTPKIVSIGKSLLKKNYECVLKAI